MVAINKFSFVLFLVLSAHVVNAISWREKISHVVVLMMENRSFDHVLGYLKSINPQINGLSGNESNPLNTTDPQSKLVYVNNQAPYVDPDPDHSVPGTTEQIFGTVHEPSVLPKQAPMNGFAQNAERHEIGRGAKIMNCFNKTALPVITTLATEFALFDNYYASVPGPTEVNRMYLHSATSHGSSFNDDAKIALGYPQKTMVQALDESGITWSSYYSDIPSLLVFDYPRHPANLEKMKFLEDFENDAANGTLANYTFIDPAYFSVPLFPATDQHPSHNMAEGEKLIKKVYEALRKSPLWDKTLLIITYDEHGGFYDHQPTPLQDVPNPDGMIATNPPFNFTRIGIRVPCLLISPWIKKGQLVGPGVKPTADSQFEHSSIPAFLKKLFNTTGSFLTRRDAWASTFEHMLEELPTPRIDCPMNLPSPPYFGAMPYTSENNLISDLQVSWVQLASALINDTTSIDVKSMKEGEAGCYIRKSIAKFLKRDPPSADVCA